MFDTVLNISGFWIYHGSEYASGSEYAKGSKYTRVTQGSEYAWIYLYREREQTYSSFRNTNETFRLFLRMLLLSGSHKLADHKMYWETSPILKYK